VLNLFQHQAGSRLTRLAGVAGTSTFLVDSYFFGLGLYSEV